MLSTISKPATSAPQTPDGIAELVRHASAGARREQRFVAAGPFSGADETGEFSGITRDMSSVGAGLLCDRDVSGGLTLRAPQVSGSSLIRARPLWSRPAFGRWWLVGIEFHRQGIIQTLRLWLAGQTGRLRRRLEHRQPFFAPVRVLERNTTGDGIAGCSLNISQNGIGVALPGQTKTRVGRVAVEFDGDLIDLRATRRWQKQIHPGLYLSGWQFAPVTRALSDLAR